LRSVFWKAAASRWHRTRSCHYDPGESWVKQAYARDQVTIQHLAGLHARPAALFVQTAKRYQSDIVVSHGARSANAKSILSVLALGAGQGAEITLQAKSQEADAALEALQMLIASNFGEAAAPAAS
jgi:phosphotransferase system HPr (HPr) family protein